MPLAPQPRPNLWNVTKKHLFIEPAAARPERETDRQTDSEEID